MPNHVSRVPVRIALAAAAAALALAIPLAGAPSASANQACQSVNASPASAPRRTMVRATLCLLNAKRAHRGLPKLHLNWRLARSSRRHARDMATRKYFSHDSLSGADFVARIRRAGYLRGARSWVVGENLAWGSGDLATPGAIVRAWMNSPGHRANILTGRFRQIGIGVSYAAPVNGVGWPAATYATDFGAKH
jgi:uncharacterized protein YkwD